MSENGIDVYTDFILRGLDKAGADWGGFVSKFLASAKQLSAVDIAITPRLVMPDPSRVSTWINAAQQQAKALEIQTMLRPPTQEQLAAMVANLKPESVVVPVQFVPEGGSVVRPAATTAHPGAVPPSVGGVPVNTARLTTAVDDIRGELEDLALLLARANEGIRGAGARRGGGGGRGGRDNPFDEEPAAPPPPEPPGGLYDIAGDYDLVRPRGRGARLVDRQAMVRDRTAADKAARDAMAAQRRATRFAKYNEGNNGNGYDGYGEEPDSESEKDEKGKGGHGGLGFGRGQVGHILLSQLSPRAGIISYAAQHLKQYLAASGVSEATLAVAGGVGGLAALGGGIIADSFSSDMAMSGGMSEAAYTGRVNGRAAQVQAETAAARSGVSFFGRKTGEWTRWLGYETGNKALSSYTADSERVRDQAVQREADFGSRDMESDLGLAAGAATTQRDTLGASGYVTMLATIDQRRKQQAEENRRRARNINESGQSDAQKQDQLAALATAQKAQAAVNDTESGRADQANSTSIYESNLLGAGDTRGAAVLKREEGFTNRLSSAAKALADGKLTIAQYTNEQDAVKAARAADDQIYGRQQGVADAVSKVTVGAAGREGAAAGREANLSNDRQSQLQDRLAAIDDTVKVKQANVEQFGKGTPERIRAEAEATAAAEKAKQDKIKETSEAKRNWAIEDAGILASTNASLLKAFGDAYDADQAEWAAAWDKKINTEQDAATRSKLIQEKAAEQQARQYQFVAMARQLNASAALKEGRLDGRGYQATKEDIEEQTMQKGIAGGLYDAKNKRWKTDAELTPEHRDARDALDRDKRSDLKGVERDRQWQLSDTQLQTDQANARAVGRYQLADTYGTEQGIAKEVQKYAKDPEMLKKVLAKDKAQLREQMMGDQHSETFGSVAEYANQRLTNSLNNDGGAYAELKAAAAVLDSASKSIGTSADTSAAAAQSIIDKLATF